MNRIYKYSWFIRVGLAHAKTFVQYINFELKQKNRRKQKQELRLEQNADEAGALTQ